MQIEIISAKGIGFGIQDIVNRSLERPPTNFRSFVMGQKSYLLLLTVAEAMTRDEIQSYMVDNCEGHNFAFVDSFSVAPKNGDDIKHYAVMVEDCLDVVGPLDMARKTIECYPGMRWGANL